MDKSEIRRSFRKIRDNANRVSKDAIIWNNLRVLEVYAKASQVYTYLNFGSEVSTLPIFADAKLTGKQLAVPRIISKSKMEFVWYEDPDRLKPNKLGIIEPVGGEIAIPSERSIFIVPGLVFSKTMHRIGYGGGFYDAYFSKINSMPAVVKIGLCYDFQIVKHLPIEPWDVKMDYIVTDERVIK